MATVTGGSVVLVRTSAGGPQLPQPAGSPTQPREKAAKITRSHHHPTALQRVCVLHSSSNHPPIRLQSTTDLSMAVARAPSVHERRPAAHAPACTRRRHRPSRSGALARFWLRRSRLARHGWCRAGERGRGCRT
ncbi:unnamed protein product [Urochloa humidicola]